MIRIVLLNLLLLMLPTILYIGFVHLTSNGPPKSLPRLLDEAPLPWLLLAGAAIVAIMMLVFATPPSGRPGEAYNPPVFRDGKIIPGKLKEKTKGGSDAPKNR